MLLMRLKELYIYIYIYIYIFPIIFRLNISYDMQSSIELFLRGGGVHPAFCRYVLEVANLQCMKLKL